jgi:Zn-dependent M28 family amino/carboxypeptidase
VLISNEGTIGDPERIGLINGTVGGYGVTVPTLEMTYQAGRVLHDAFVQNKNPTASMSATTRTRTLGSVNVIAETTTGRTDRTVISGAHLDSVPEGAGINDDGSGSATQIEVALQMAKLGIKPVNQVRFIWFSGEEYDGDGSEFGVAGPNGSGTVESVFQQFYDARGLYTERIEFDGRSDYDEFTVVGIPAGGIAAGAEVHKTPFQRSKWGGVVSDGLAGQFDPCYHLACDSYPVNGHPDNINNTALDINSDAVAHAVLTFAQTTSATNGTDNGSGSSVKAYEWKGDHRVK